MVMDETQCFQESLACLRRCVDIARTPPPAFLFLRLTCQRADSGRNNSASEALTKLQRADNRSRLRIDSGTCLVFGPERCCPKGMRTSQDARGVTGCLFQSIRACQHPSQFFCRLLPERVETPHNSSPFPLKSLRKVSVTATPPTSTPQDPTCGGWHTVHLIRAVTTRQRAIPARNHHRDHTRLCQPPRTKTDPRSTVETCHAPAPSC